MDALVARIAALARGGPQPVEVVGTNALAELLRAELPGAGRVRSERPGTVVATTGDLAELEDAFRRIQSLGLVVLAAAPDGSAQLDLYADVHVRGLTVIGVAEAPA